MLNQYYVILELDLSYQLSPNALTRIYVKAADGAVTPLGQFASVSSSIAPLAVNHQGQIPSVTLSFNLAPGATIGEAVWTIQQTVADMRLPPSIASSFQGNAPMWQQQPYPGTA